jgi:membrane-bound lytic murein transglycosylase D
MSRKTNTAQYRLIRWWYLMPLVVIPLICLAGITPVQEATETYPAAVEVVQAELPLHINEDVERWIELFQTVLKSDFEIFLSRRGAYGDLVRDALRAKGMPEDLLYLAMIESGLKPRAVSNVSAVGLWQFMSPTALQYGLRVDSYVDERRDPIGATEAALDYLDWLHGRFGSWYLAAAAYNAGPGRVERVLRRYADGRIGDENLYWEIVDHLPKETREYVPRLIAATILGKDASAYGFVFTSTERYDFELVFVPSGTSLLRVASALEIDVGILRNLNPHLVRGVTPPSEVYGVRVPVGGSQRVVASLATGPDTRRADD